MKTRIYKFFFVICIFSSLEIFAQSSKIVLVTTNGEGKTKDEAISNALRNAIEQTFGAFITSKTEILNDELLSDEIATVSSGNIQEYTVISETKTNLGNWAINLKAKISLSNLNSFSESKGLEVDFKGSLFSFNIMQQNLNETSELKAITNLNKVFKDLANISFDYKLETQDPIKSGDGWEIPIIIKVFKNDNFENLIEYFFTTLSGLSMTKDEAEDYISMGKDVFPVSIAKEPNDYGYFIMRNEKSIELILSMMYHFNFASQNFSISNDIEKWEIKNRRENISYIYDYGLRFLLAYTQDKDGGFSYGKASFFYLKDNFLEGNLKFIDDRCQFGYQKEPIERSFGARWKIDNCNFILGKNIYDLLVAKKDERRRYYFPEEKNDIFKLYFGENKELSTEHINIIWNPYDQNILSQFAFIYNFKDVVKAKNPWKYKYNQYWSERKSQLPDEIYAGLVISFLSPKNSYKSSYNYHAIYYHYLRADQGLYYDQRPIVSNFDRSNLNEVVRFYYSDFRNIEELKIITGYNISSNSIN